MTRHRIISTALLLTALTLHSDRLLAQWELTSGPYGGTINTFFIHPTGIYGGSDGGGIVRSRDDGRTWKAVGSRAVATSVRKFIANGPQMYAATSSGVIVSDDGGDTWRATGKTGLPSSDTRSVAFQRTTMFAATWGGLAQSSDSGATWKQITSPVFHVVWFVAVAANDSVVIAGSDRCVFRSSNGGVTWDTALSVEFMGVHDVMFDGPTCFVTCEQGLARSDDNGRTWKWLGGSNVVAFARSADGTFYRGSSYLYGLFRSSDSGATWNEIDKGMPVKSFSAIVTSGSTVLVADYSYGVYRSTDDGATWTRSTDGILSVNVRQVAANRKAVFAATDYGGLQRSTDLGATWVNVGASFNSAQVISIAVIEDTILAATANDAYLYRSIDNGASWDEIFHVTGDYLITAFLVDGNDIYMADNRHVARSTDHGLTWAKADSALPDAYVTGFAANSHAIFACTNTTWTGSGGGVFRSTDHGGSWKLLNTGLTTYTDVYALAAIDDTILAGTGSSLYAFYRSTDDGNSWSKGGAPCRVHGEFLKAGSVLYSTVPIANGVSRSSDNGKTWEGFDEGESTVNANSLCAIGNYLFAGVDNGSVIRRRVEGLSGDVAVVKDDEHQMTVYPNPVEDGIITVHLPVHSERIELQLYNGLGEVVGSGTRHNAVAGGTELDVRDLPAGLYLLRAIVDGKRYTAGVLVR